MHEINTSKEQEIKRLDLEISKGKLLIKHLLQVYKQHKSMVKRNEVSPEQYMDIIFEMVVSSKDYLMAKSITEFTDLMSTKIKKLLEVEENESYEVIFIEKVCSD